MSDGLTLSMSGMSAILGALGAVSEKLQAQIQQTLTDAADEAVQVAQSLCPVDTGYLQSTIAVGESNASTIQVVCAADYALFVEMGHHTRSGSWVDPQPFLQPAMDQAGQHFKAQLEGMAL